MLASLLIAWLAVGAAPNAWADVAPSPGEERTSYCEPEQQEGDDCVTDSGDEGTCSDEEDVCYPAPDFEADRCLVCEEDCSVAAVGAQPPSRLGGMPTGLLLALGLLLLRRRS